MIIMLCFHIQMSINHDCFFKKSLHLHYRDMHWNSIESAQAGFCAYIYKKKAVKGESSTSFHCLLKNTKIEWNMKSHIFYKGSSELRGENTKYFFLTHMFAKNFKI